MSGSRVSVALAARRLAAPIAALLLAPLAAPLAANAETPMTATEFETHVTGMTVTYQQAGGIFGIEEYLPGRKVRWSVAPGECQYGSWYPEADAICFVYEYDPTPHCWTFWMQGGVMMARPASALPGADLSEVDRSASPLPCPGPDLGA
jgi:hypothetical protein